MRTQNIGPFLGAFLVLLSVSILGDWDQNQGLSGLTPLALAQEAAAQDDERDRGKKDHFACYEVKCLNRYNRPTECPKVDEKVILFNQFTEGDDDNHHPRDRDDEGIKVEVQRLKLLCVPTRKEHRDRDDDRD